MTDGSRRLVVTSRGVPVGAFDADENVEFSIDPSPAPAGTTETQPPSVPFDFANYNGVADNYPFEPLLAELLFTSYEYSAEYGDAVWSAAMFADGVNLNTASVWVQNNDLSAVALAVFE